MALQRDQMAELRETAKSYYNALPREVQEKAVEFFCVMDDNRDGKINLHEFLSFLWEEGYTEMLNESFFKKLDKNGDGALDFEEVMTLYYIIKSGRPFCLGCTQLIEGLFFTCVQCFDCDGSTFNVCPICFGTGQYLNVSAPQWTQSLMPQRSSSSYASLAIVPGPQRTQSQRSSSSSALLPIVPATPHTRWTKWRIALRAFENMIGVGNIGVGLCTLM